MASQHSLKFHESLRPMATSCASETRELSMVLKNENVINATQRCDKRDILLQHHVYKFCSIHFLVSQSIGLYEKKEHSIYWPLIIKI